MSFRTISLIKLAYHWLNSILVTLLDEGGVVADAIGIDFVCEPSRQQSGPRQREAVHASLQAHTSVETRGGFKGRPALCSQMNN